MPQLYGVEEPDSHVTIIIANTMVLSKISTISIPGINQKLDPNIPLHFYKTNLEHSVRGVVIGPRSCSSSDKNCQCAVNINVE